MKLIIPNLTRRLDKYGGMKAWIHIFGYPMKDVAFWTSHDGSDYRNADDLLHAMEKSGYPMDRGCLDVNLVADRDIRQSPINVMSHLGLRWTYLDILKEIYQSGEAAIVLLDDMYLTNTPSMYDELHARLVHNEGDLLGLDPSTIHEEKNLYDEATRLLTCGYDSPTEEAILWRPKGAERMIPLLINNTKRIIGDLIRDVYPQDKVWTTTHLFARSIGEKEDWISDVHVIEPAKYRRTVNGI